MDYNLLKEKTDLIIKGLECMADPESELEFISLLDNFTLKMMEKCKAKIAEQKAMMN